MIWRLLVVWSVFMFEDDDHEGDKSILAFRIKFASGKEIVALSSSPTNLRGRQGRVVIDEAAFHKDLAAVLKSALALLMHALWTDPVDQAPPVQQISELVPPVCVGAGLNIGGYTPIGVSSLTLNLAAEVVKRTDLNAAEGVSGLVIKSRKPAGTLDPEVETLATFNPWAAWKAASKASIHAGGGDLRRSLHRV